jgi:hypothetical protein
LKGTICGSPKKKDDKKTSLMGIAFSRSSKSDMAKVLASPDLDGVAE